MIKSFVIKTSRNEFLKFAYKLTLGLIIINSRFENLLNLVI